MPHLQLTWMLALLQFRRSPRGLAAALLLLGLFGSASVWADDYDDVANLMRNGRPTEALQRINQVMATRPRDPQMRFFKGMIERESGQTSQALETFLTLTQDYPELPEPHNNLAVIYAVQNELDKARASLENALRNNPNYAIAHENLGDLYLRLAAMAYQNAQKLGPGGPALNLKITNLTALAQGTPQGPSR